MNILPLFLATCLSLFCVTTCAAQNGKKMMGKSEPTTSVDLSSKELRAKWLADWLDSTKTIFDNVSPEEAEEHSQAMIRVSLERSREAARRMPEAQSAKAATAVFEYAITNALPAGSYLSLPADGSPIRAWKTGQFGGKNVLGELPIEAVLNDPRLSPFSSASSASQQQQNTASTLTQQVATPASVNQEAIAKYNTWRKSFKGRMYATQMSLNGFVPIYDPATGIEKWVPKNSLGVVHYQNHSDTRLEVLDRVSLWTL